MPICVNILKFSDYITGFFSTSCNAAGLISTFAGLTLHFCIKSPFCAPEGAETPTSAPKKNCKIRIYLGYYLNEDPEILLDFGVFEKGTIKRSYFLIFQTCFCSLHTAFLKTISAFLSTRCFSSEIKCCTCQCRN